MPRSRATLYVAGLLVAASLSACGGSTPTWSGEVRDSAGVSVIVNRGGGMWGDSPWTVAEDLRIGGDESRPETLFGYVPDLAVDAAGRMYVLDQHAQEVRVFSADGAYVGPIGSPGEGPGELSRFAASVMVDGDTLLVADWGRSAMHRFRVDGAFVDSKTFPGAPGARSWWRRTDDGTLLFRQLTRHVDDDGRWRGTDGLHRADPDWATTDSVLAFSYDEADLGGPGHLRLPLVVNAPSWAARPGGGIAWTSLDSDRLRLTVGGGALRSLVTRDAWETRAPTVTDEEALLERMGDKLVMLGGDRAIMQNLEVEQPARLPAITSVRAGPRGTLWVQRMGAVEDVHPMALNTPDPPVGWGGREWDVFDGEGRYQGTLTMPARFRLARITEGSVYGVATTELGADVVVRLALQVPGA